MLAISILGIKDNYEKLKELDNLHPDYLHFDIMDGQFVEQTVDLLNLPLFASKKDIHLMVKDVKKYIDLYKKLEPEYLTFHLEASDNIKELVDYIHKFNIKVGLSLKPNTPVSNIIPYLELIDLVLVMSVEPGYGGQKFLSNAIDKVKELARLREKYQYQYMIEIDGGINDKTIKMVSDCDIFVVGSYITNSNDYQAKINSLK